METSNLKMMTSMLTPTVGNEDLLPIKRSVMIATKEKTAIVPLQKLDGLMPANMAKGEISVKGEKGHKPLKTKGFAVSRRDMMQCLTAEVVGLTVLPKPAEARLSRLEMRKKIMEKLEELREKAGLSKPKTENGMKSPTLPLPPPEGTVRPLVEATLKNIPPPNNAL